MDNPDRPVFTPEIDFHIEQVQNQADRLAWQQLRALQVPTAISRKMMKAAYPPEFVGPPDPQKPKEILLHIRTYARTLYLAEGNFYQTGAHVEEQLRKLADRIVERVGATVADVEESAVKLNISLSHHGVSMGQMQLAALREVNELIGKRLEPQGITSGKSESVAKVNKSPRIRDSVDCPEAARKMEEHVQTRGITMTQFAIEVGTSDRTLRKFRNTGRVKKSIFADIAKAMGITKESLLNI